uniref:Uncharacterized protein n=1 Tax=Bionectria ochroleuca TaxID=29856 RepID=A0A8H7K8M8_BIOOC
MACGLLDYNLLGHSGFSAPLEARESIDLSPRSLQEQPDASTSPLRASIMSAFPPPPVNTIDWSNVGFKVREVNGHIESTWSKSTGEWTPSASSPTPTCESTAWLRP